jgi:hypothetical protein
MSIFAPYVAALPIYEEFAQYFNNDPNNLNNIYLEPPQQQSTATFNISEHLINPGPIIGIYGY